MYLIDLCHKLTFSHVASPGPAAPIWEFPALLHLVQPYALDNLCTALKHVVLFHDRLRGKRAKEENTQIAKEVFFDLIERSGINLDGLVSLLSISLQDTKVISGISSHENLKDQRLTPFNRRGCSKKPGFMPAYTFHATYTSEDRPKNCDVGRAG